MSFDITGLAYKIEEWARDRNLIGGATSQAQMLKLTEEVGELANAVARNNLVNMSDAIGDCFVVLTILACQNNLHIGDCISNAYDVIKDRKGKMIDGVFVKEEDLGVAYFDITNRPINEMPFPKTVKLTPQEFNNLII